MAWVAFLGSDSEWDRLILELGSRSPFSLSTWAKTRIGNKWSTVRLVDVTGERPNSAVQVFVFTFLRILNVCWAPGGVCGVTSVDVSDLMRNLSLLLGRKLVYFRASFHQPHQESAALALQQNRWHKPISRIGAEETFIVTRRNGLLADKDRLSSNWARNLQRGLKRKNNYSTWQSPNSNEIGKLYDEMVHYKKARGPRDIPSIESIDRLFSCLGESVVCIQVRNDAGQLLAIRAAIIIGHSAWDALAATNEEGRKSYASYVCAWRLIEVLDGRGINQFDLAGIDPLNNEGVFNFKKGFGGEYVRYLGEWEASRPGIIRLLVGRLISKLG